MHTQQQQAAYANIVLSGGSHIKEIEGTLPEVVLSAIVAHCNGLKAHFGSLEKEKRYGDIAALLKENKVRSHVVKTIWLQQSLPMDLSNGKAVRVNKLANKVWLAIRQLLFTDPRPHTLEARLQKELKHIAKNRPNEQYLLFLAAELIKPIPTFASIQLMIFSDQGAFFTFDEQDLDTRKALQNIRAAIAIWADLQYHDGICREGADPISDMLSALYRNEALTQAQITSALFG